MSNADLQLPLDEEESKQYVSIKIHKCIFQYSRLPFVFLTALAIFQHYMNILLFIVYPCAGFMEKSLAGVSDYLDDILITGSTLEVHPHLLQNVVEKPQAARLHLNHDKCSFIQPSITYLGHMINQYHLHPTQEKI